MRIPTKASISLNFWAFLTFIQSHSSSNSYCSSTIFIFSTTLIKVSTSYSTVKENIIGIELSLHTIVLVSSSLGKINTSPANHLLSHPA